MPDRHWPDHVVREIGAPGPDAPERGICDGCGREHIVHVADVPTPLFRRLCFGCIAQLTHEAPTPATEAPDA